MFKGREWEGANAGVGVWRPTLGGWEWVGDGRWEEEMGIWGPRGRGGGGGWEIGGRKVGMGDGGLVGEFWRESSSPPHPSFPTPYLDLPVLPPSPKPLQPPFLLPHISHISFLFSRECIFFAVEN